jgi:hypothetical protein
MRNRYPSFTSRTPLSCPLLHVLDAAPPFRMHDPSLSPTHLSSLFVFLFLLCFAFLFPALPFAPYLTRIQLPLLKHQPVFSHSYFSIWFADIFFTPAMSTEDVK